MNLSIYRPTTIEELTTFRKTAGEDFEAYLKNVYKHLLAMRPGGIFDIVQYVDPKNHNWFLKSCCFFIIEGGTDYEFSNDYLKIKRLMRKPEIEIAEFYQQLTKKKNELEAAKTKNRETDSTGEDT